MQALNAGPQIPLIPLNVPLQLYPLTYQIFSHTHPCAVLIRLLSISIFRIHAISERHAAASYGHSDILTYLISKGNKGSVVARFS